MVKYSIKIKQKCIVREENLIWVEKILAFWSMPIFNKILKTFKSFS